MSLESVNEIYYLRFDYMKNLKLSRRGYLIGKFVFSNHMETSGEKARKGVLTKLFVCKICTVPFIVGKILRLSKNYLLTTLQCRS